MITQVTPQGNCKMTSHDIQRSLRLLDYDSYDIRVIYPNRTSTPAQLIHSIPHSADIGLMLQLSQPQPFPVWRG